MAKMNDDPFKPQMTAQQAPGYAAQAKAIGDSAQASAVTGAFDEAKGVAGRVGQITSAGGSLMTAARTRAKQASAARGLQNTSTAAQAGEQAVIETALPMASGDAQLYQNQQLANQNAQNQTNLANANIRAQTGIAGMNLGENARQFDTGLAWDRDKFGTNLMEQRRQFDANYGLQGRQLDQNQKQFESTLGLEGRKLDQSQSQFQQTIGLEGQKLAQNQSQFTAQLGQQDQQFKANLDLQKDNLAAQREQFAQRLGMDQQQLQLNRDQLSQQDRQFLADLDQKAAQLAQQESQFTRDQENKVTLANLDANNREKLIEIEAKYKSDIASNENISRAWGTMMDSINQIQNNPELDYSTKATQIANTQAAFESFTKFWNKVGGGATDVSDLLRFGQVGPPAPAPAPSPYGPGYRPSYGDPAYMDPAQVGGGS